MTPTNLVTSNAKRRIYMYTPVPPIRSGTAHYLDLLLKQLSDSISSDFQVILVIDKQFYRDSSPLDSLGFDILDFRHIKRQSDDISLYFLANNEFHRYVHKSLFDHKTGEGLAVSIVHEPSMWMNIQAMCNLHEYGFNERDLLYFAQYEFGEDAPVVHDLFRRNLTDTNFEYTSLAGTHIYEKSDVVVFHSRFAMYKFATERSSTYTALRSQDPLYLVMQHPPESGLNDFPKIEKSKSKFVVGTFGWVQKTKQTDALILGFNEFYKDLSDEDKIKTTLSIVGQVNIASDFNPQKIAEELECSGNVDFHGYVSDEEMDRLMAESSIVFSLRFPSCGETSGPLYKANALGIPVVLSDYAAFAEEKADYHVPVEKNLQHREIVRILKSEFELYKSEVKRDVIKHTPSGMTINQVIDSLIEYQG